MHFLCLWWESWNWNGVWKYRREKGENKWIFCLCFSLQLLSFKFFQVSWVVGFGSEFWAWAWVYFLDLRRWLETHMFGPWGCNKGYIRALTSERFVHIILNILMISGNLLWISCHFIILLLIYFDLSLWESTQLVRFLNSVFFFFFPQFYKLHNFD